MVMPAPGSSQYSKFCGYIVPAKGPAIISALAFSIHLRCVSTSMMFPTNEPVLLTGVGVGVGARGPAGVGAVGEKPSEQEANSRIARLPAKTK